MHVAFTDRFRRSYAGAPDRVRRAFAKQITYLKADLRHPSLRAKRFEESTGVWQARVDRDWRFYFVLDGDTCWLLDIMPHPK